MSISRVAGQMLNSNLQRDGVDLAIDTNLLYIDVGNNRVGVNTATPGVDLDVNGNIRARNLTASQQITAVGNATLGNVNTAGVVTATGNITGGNVIAIANIVGTTGMFANGNTVIGTGISTTGNVTANSGVFAGGNTVIASNVTTTGNISGSDVSVSGNVIAGTGVTVGNIRIPVSGNITVGNVNIVDLANPVANTDAATKYYVDTNISNAANNVNFTVSDGTNTQQIFNGDTLRFSGTANQTTVTVSAVDSVTIGLPNSVTVGNVTANTFTAVANILVGNINIPSTGNVSLGNVNLVNLASPVANTDAATKQYTDVRAANTVLSAFGNLVISNTTITSTLATGNITLATTGNSLVYISGTSGVAIPVGNTQQRPETPAAGTLRFNSGSETVEVYTGAVWQSAGSVISNVTNQTIVPDGVANTYTLDQSSTAVNILVSINGITQTPSIDYTVAGDQITFTTVPLTTDIVQVRYIANTATVVEISNTTGNSAVQVTDTPAVVFKVNNYNIAEFNANRVLNMSASRGLQLPTYTVAEATALPAPAAGQVIYVSNGDSGAACLAVYSDGAWRRVNLGAAISA